MRCSLPRRARRNPSAGPWTALALRSWAARPRCHSWQRECHGSALSLRCVWRDARREPARLGQASLLFAAGDCFSPFSVGVRATAGELRAQENQPARLRRAEPSTALAKSDSLVVSGPGHLWFRQATKAHNAPPRGGASSAVDTIDKATTRQRTRTNLPCRSGILMPSIP